MPPKMRAKLALILLFLAVVTMPLVGSFLRWKGLPPGYGTYPTQLVSCPDPAPCKPSFSPGIFCVYVAAGLVLVAFFVWPRLFGFKPAPGRPRAAPVDLPFWFWIGLVLNVFGLVTLWGQIVPFAHYAFVPLWWGFILAIDGCVYARTGGRSLLYNTPGTLGALAITSAIGWYLYEYMNYFLLENWYYPNNGLLSAFGYSFWYLLAFTTVWPAIFEWYDLLTTFPWLERRWQDGPKISLGDTTLVILVLAGLGSLVVMALLPTPFFALLWIGLLVVFSAALPLFGFWSPFTPIATKGNWSRVARWALAGLVNGFFWEFWNYGSVYFSKGPPTNPNFWKYDVPYVNIPYVDTKHLFFTEMPIVGYFGYLPFGLLCATWWVLWAHLFDLQLDPDPRLLPVPRDVAPPPDVPASEEHLANTTSDP